MYFQFGFKSPQMTDKMNHFSLSIESLITFLRVQLQSPYFDQNLSQEKIFSLVQQLHEAQVFPENIRLTSLESALQAVFGLILTKGEPDSTFVITADHVEWLENEYERWKSIQNVLNQLEPIQFSFPPQAIQLTSLKNLPQDVQQDFYSIFKFRNIFNEEDEQDFKVYLSYKDELLPKGYKNLTMRSLYLSGVRAIQRGYARKYPKQGITDSELVQFLTDIYGLSEDMNIEDSSKPPNKSIFLAAHLVTYSTQGYYNDLFIQEGEQKIELLEQKEGIDYLSLLPVLSSSMNTVYSTLQEFCRQEKITADCFNSHILTALKNLQNLPHVIEDVSNLNPEEETSYKEILLKITLLDETKVTQALNQPDTYFIRPIELKNLIYGLIFQETTFTRFDLNQDAILDHREIDLAFPIYENAIALSFKDSSREPYSRAAYDYSVRYRSLPYQNEQNKLWTNIQIFWFRLIQPNNQQLTRRELLEITSYLLSGFKNPDEVK